MERYFCDICEDKISYEKDHHIVSLKIYSKYVRPSEFHACLFVNNNVVCYKCAKELANKVEEIYIDFKNVKRMIKKLEKIEREQQRTNIIKRTKEIIKNYENHGERKETAYKFLEDIKELIL